MGEKSFIEHNLENRKPIMSRLTQLIKTLFRRNQASPPPNEDPDSPRRSAHQQPTTWSITCPYCQTQRELPAKTIDSQQTCESCKKVFEPHPEAVTLSVACAGNWATVTLQNLYADSSAIRHPPTVDWKPSGFLQEACPHCKTKLNETVEYYSLNRCPSCQAVFRPVLESVGVGTNHTLERFGRFPIIKTLGHGGMGIVYLAHHPERDVPIALKVILNDDDWSGVSRFYREGETVARLKHPHIIKIREVGQYDGIPYLALEYLEGGSLLDKLNQERLSIAEAVSVSITLARTLEFAHQRGVIHRDLKPANVLLTEEGTPKISDFGLVKRTSGATELGMATISIPGWYSFLRRLSSEPVSRGDSLLAPHPDLLIETGLVLGTPAYMAPEQTLGDSENVGAAADIFALGAMLYQMLTGRLPFPGNSSWETLKAVQSVEPVAPSVWNLQIPKRLEEIVLKCLSKVPEDRFRSAEELAQALETQQVS